MKFSADKNTLYEAVSSASKACALKSALNILDGVLLDLDGDTLTVTGYDLEIGIKVSMEVAGKQDGKVVTDPRLFSEMVKKMPGDTVDFILVDDKNIKITSGKSKLSIPCKSGDEFPGLIELKKDTSFEISEKLLKEMFMRVGFAVSRTNQEFEAIRMEIENNLFYTVATDGNRLAAKHCAIENEDVSFTIPEKAVSSLVKSLSDEAPNDDTLPPKTVNVFVDRNQICISKENYVLISRLLEGKFVNYKRIIEADFPRVLTVNVKELALSMERCLLLQSDKLRIPVTCSVGNGFMNITCKTTLGAIDEEIPATIKDGDFLDYSINFNPRFMLEALQKTNCDEVKISFDGSLKPFKITPLENNDQDNGGFIFVIVPIRSS